MGTAILLPTNKPRPCTLCCSPQLSLLSFLIRSYLHVSNLSTNFGPTAPLLICVNSGRLGHCAARLGCDVCPLLFFPFSLGLRPLRFVTLLILSTPFLFSK